jgi:hypothetical protein
VFGPGSRPGNTTQCSQGADGGAGVSCHLNIDFEAGKWYRIESKVIEKSADGERRWQGTFIDEETDTRTIIADFYTSASYGALSGQCDQWLEWYRYNNDGLKPAQRNCQPKFNVHYGLPHALNPNKSEWDTPIWNGPYHGTLDDSCAVKNNLPNWNMSFNDAGELTINAGYLP